MDSVTSNFIFFKELEYLKNESSKSQILKLKANEAVEFLKKKFTAENTKFLGQLFTDVEKNKERFNTECPNDEILQICLQIQDLRPVVSRKIFLILKKCLFYIHKKLTFLCRPLFHMMRHFMIKLLCMI